MKRDKLTTKDRNTSDTRFWLFCVIFFSRGK